MARPRVDVDPRAPLVVMVGAPGSGKSTFLAARFAVDELFGLDMFRRMLTSGDVLDQDATDAAVDMLHALIRYRMATGRTTVVDATNTSWDRRDALRFYATEANRPYVLVMMHTPLEVCLERNLERNRGRTGGYRPWPGANDRAVPDEVVEQMHAAVLADPPMPDDADLVVHVHPTTTDVAYAYPGKGRSVAWCEQLLTAGRWGKDVTMLTSRQARLPWSTQRVRRRATPQAGSGA